MDNISENLTKQNIPLSHEKHLLMSYPIETDTIRRVHDKKGMALDVHPWPEDPSAVALGNANRNSVYYFGRIDLAMDTEFARQIGLALIACADEIDYAKGE